MNQYGFVLPCAIGCGAIGSAIGSAIDVRSSDQRSLIPPCKSSKNK
ncbi:hypothetical protein [Egbenema bharatensis]